MTTGPESRAIDSGLMAQLNRCTELLDVILSTRGAAFDAAVAALAANFLRSAEAHFSEHAIPAGDLVVPVAHEGKIYGHYAVAGRPGGYGEREKRRLETLARFIGWLLHVREQSEQRERSLNHAMDRLREHMQILDHIHESVIAMDLAGYITHWNRGAERMFGYAAEEAVGRHILFLYADEDADDTPLHDGFMEHGGRNLEVRRRRKSGEIFWASMNLSIMEDEDGQAVGMIGYLVEITDRKNAEARLHNLSNYDELTGLPNRSLLFELLERAIIDGRRTLSPGALLFIDLNRFKPINDTLGHTVGNRVLAEVATRLSSCVRTEDVVARIGGDEFVVGLFRIAKREHAATVAQKVLDALDAPYSIDGHELQLGATIGISVYPEDSENAADLLRLADIAMYRAKKTGIEGYAFYSEEMNRRSLDRLKIEAGLRQALDRNQLILHYQPQVDLATGRIIGAEALIRWMHPERGMISPGEFIPVAEETGLITRLGDWVLEAACAQCQAWQNSGLPTLRIGVNLSARQFVPALAERIEELLARHSLEASWLELEITESILMHRGEEVVGLLDTLAARGLTLSLDDFGTGYSSLSYLKRFPIETLKIDRSFIHGVPTDPNDCAIAGAIVVMAKQLKHRVIAEGVERQDQVDFLRALGCDEIQGYLFSKPVPAAELEAMVRADRRL